MLQTVTEKTKIAYSVDELAAATSLSKAHLRNEIRAGKLKSKKVGRRVLILQSQVDEYLNKFADAEPKNGKSNAGTK